MTHKKLLLKWLKKQIVPNFLNAIAMPAAAERMYEFFGEKSNFYFIVDLKLTCVPVDGSSEPHLALCFTKRVT